MREHIYDVLLPASAAEAAKMLVFGQSLQLGDDGIFDDGFYLPRLKQVLTAARFARVRDPVSAHRAGMITGEPAAKFLGVDAALLLPVLDPGQGDARAASDKQVGVFLGRTSDAHLAQLGLGMALRRAGLRASWLSWLPGKEAPAWVKMVLPMDGALIADDHPAVADYIAAVRRCRLIVTDAYHLTLMAWSCGVPAICIGKGRQHFTKTVHDKKKEVFYSTHYLSRYYLFSDDAIDDFRNGRYRACLDLALSSGAGTAKEVQAQIAAMATENVASLKVALAGV